MNLGKGLSPAQATKSMHDLGSVAAVAVQQAPKGTVALLVQTAVQVVVQDLDSGGRVATPARKDQIWTNSCGSA